MPGSYTVAFSTLISLSSDPSSAALPSPCERAPARALKMSGDIFLLHKAEHKANMATSEIQKRPLAAPLIPLRDLSRHSALFQPVLQFLLKLLVGVTFRGGRPLLKWANHVMS